MSTPLNEFRCTAFVQHINYYPGKEGKKSYTALGIRTSVRAKNKEGEHIISNRYAQIDYFGILAEKASKLTIDTYVYVTASLETRTLKAKQVEATINASNGSHTYPKQLQALLGSSLKALSKEPDLSPDVCAIYWHFLLVGRIGKINYIANNNSEKQSFANLSIATEISYKDKEEKWQRLTKWNKVRLFGNQADEIHLFPIGALIQVNGYVNRVPINTPEAAEKIYDHVLFAEHTLLIKHPKEKNETDDLTNSAAYNTVNSLANVEVDLNQPPPVLDISED